MAKGAHEIVTMPQEGGRGGATATMGQHVGKENERPDADFDVGKRAVAVPTGVVFGTSSAMEASTPQDARKFKDVISNAESNVARLAEVMDSAEQEIEAAFRYARAAHAPSFADDLDRRPDMPLPTRSATVL